MTQKQVNVVRRRVIAVKPVEHRRGAGKLGEPKVGLSSQDRENAIALAGTLRAQFLPGRTIIACAPTICALEMAHLFHCELETVLPLPCKSLNSRRPHSLELHNKEALVNFVGGLITGYDNIVLITHVGKTDKDQIFSSHFFENNLSVKSSTLNTFSDGNVVVVDCQL